MIDIFFAITVTSVPTLNDLVSHRCNWSRGSNTDFVAPSGSLDSDNSKTMRQLQVQEVTSNGKQTLDSEESGYRTHSRSDGEGRKPDWHDYYPDIKVSV